MRGTWTCVLMLVISAFCLEAQEGNPGADVWVSADTYPPVIEGCLQRWGVLLQSDWFGRNHL